MLEGQRSRNHNCDSEYTIYPKHWWKTVCVCETLLIQDLRLHMAFLLLTASHSLLCPIIQEKRQTDDSCTKQRSEDALE